MIIFNCSQAFAEFIEPRKTGSAPLVGEAPSPRPSEDGPHLVDVDGRPPREVKQWQAHLALIQGKPCAIVVDIDSSYAMFFPGLKAGDPEGFLDAFATRLVNEMVFAAQTAGMMADFDAMLGTFQEKHARFQFVLRIEHSTLEHLDDTARNFENEIVLADLASETHEECAVIDARINHAIRGLKTEPDQLLPEEEMLCSWLRDFGGLTADGESALRKQLRAKKLRVTAEPGRA